jgi:hypothetical protein
MFKILIILSVLASTCFSAEFRRTAGRSNEYAGTRAVFEYISQQGQEYVVPLSDSVEQKLHSFSRFECIIIKGSLNNGVIYARSIRKCISQ